MEKKIFLIGSGSHAALLLKIIRRQGNIVSGVISKDLKKNDIYHDIPVIENDSKILNYDPKKIILVNGIGQLPNNRNRTKITKYFKKNNFEFLTIIDENSIIAQSAKICEGAQIMAGTIIQENVIVGENSIINTGSILEHDVKVDSNCHLATGTICCGNVHIKDETFIGAGSLITQNVIVGRETIIAGRSVVTKNIIAKSKLIKN
tara:strand:+ start:8615 stop:9229 length:615 start_codon:yes stop_codon:yes gene_type:complete